MKKRIILLIAGGLLFGGCVSAQKDMGYRKLRDPLPKDSASALKDRIQKIPNDDLIPYQYTGSNQVLIQYRLLSPAKGSRQERYPLVLVLHGSGAVGTDNVRQLGVLAKLWVQPEIREKYPAFVVVPQFPQRSSNYHPDSSLHVLVSTPAPCLSTALQLIDSLKKVLPVDEDRIYVIGFSMGASGAINSLELQPDLFAAAISISGIPAFHHLNRLKEIPIWLIHGNADTENPMGGDSLLFKEIRQGRKTKFWEIDHLDHAIYSELYSTDLVPRWLFRQRKAKVI